MDLGSYDLESYHSESYRSESCYSETELSFRKLSRKDKSTLQRAHPRQQRDCMRARHMFAVAAVAVVAVVVVEESPSLYNIYFQLVNLKFYFGGLGMVDRQTDRQSISNRNSVFSQQACNNRVLSIRSLSIRSLIYRMKDRIEVARERNKETKKQMEKEERITGSQSRSNTTSHCIALREREREEEDIDG
ncbi:hypothetical protein BD560DRAFT_431330 [Blakeslea trispora]|nr:hypothetical protein BD560DRAFT_431330 [Blakeslea trispora]